MPIFDRIPMRPFSIGTVQLGAKAGLALTSAYTYNSAGAAITVHFFGPSNTTLTDVYFFVTAVTGTPGNLTVELRDISSVNKPGSTLIASTTISPGAAANKWIHATFSTPPSITEDTIYHLVVADAAGSASNAATVASAGGLATGEYINAWAGATTSNGFVAQAAARAIPMVLAFGDGRLLGNPYTTSASYASIALERGLKITGLTEKLIISGVNAGTMQLMSNLKIYSGSAAPGSTPDLTVSLASQSSLNLPYAQFAPFTLQKNTVYRIVFSFSSANAVPSYLQIEDGASFANVLNCGFGGGAMYSTIDNGAGGWTDETDKFPAMALSIRDQVAAAGGGVSRARIVAGG